MRDACDDLKCLNNSNGQCNLYYRNVVDLKCMSVRYPNEGDIPKDIDGCNNDFCIYCSVRKVSYDSPKKTGYCCKDRVIFRNGKCTSMAYKDDGRK